MYEMEGPRPVSRHRPADFSASFAPLNHLPGPGTLPVSRSRPDHRVARGPRATDRAFLFATEPGVAPKPDSAKYLPHRVAQGFLSPIDRGFPQAEKAQVFPSPSGSELSFPHMTRGFPSVTA